MSKSSLTNGIRLLDFLKQNTDKNHPATQHSIREQMGEELSKQLMGDKGTYARRLKELADAYNIDENGMLLDESEFKINYPGYLQSENSSKRNGKVYYNHPIDEEELAFLIECVRFTHNFTEEEKLSLEARLKNTLGSKHYPSPEEMKGCLIRKLDETITGDTQKIEGIIKQLREHIKHGYMTDITVLDTNGNNPTLYQVSPYRLVQKDSYFWLICNWHERPAETYNYPRGREYYKYDRFFPWYTNNLTSFRIDLIEEVKTARVPKETKVHWTMNPIHMGPLYGRKKYIIQESLTNNPRKVRNRDNMKEVLLKFDQIAHEVKLEHGCDIVLQ